MGEEGLFQTDEDKGEDKMRVIIAGSRSIEEFAEVAIAVEESGFNVTEVVSGKARGVDTLGEAWAEESEVPVKPFPADWKKRGNDAGKRRNTEMAEYADALVAVWDGVSTGTQNMIDQMRFRDKPVFIRRVRCQYSDV